MGEVRQILKDNTEVYPVTVVEAISNTDGESLKSIINKKIEAADLRPYATALQVNTQLALKANSADLAEVATTGTFGSLTNKPTTLAGYGITDAAKSSEVIADLNDKADKSTTLSGYGITDAYTKSEIDGKLTSALHWKGSDTCENISALTDVEVGDTWNVTNDGTIGSETVKAGDNIVWSGTAWDKYSNGFADMSNYYTKEQTDALVADKQDKLSGQSTDFGAVSLASNGVSIIDAPVKYGEGDNSDIAGYRDSNTATGAADFVAGSYNVINGNYSSAFGYDNITGNGFSFTAGQGLLNGEADGTNNTSHQAVFGKYNRPSGSFMRITGNGTGDDNRSNCETLSSGGEMWVASDIMCGGTDQWSAAHKLSNKLDDAPSDNNQYARKNGAWTVVTGGSGGSEIDDNSISTSTTWSSSKIATSISGVYRYCGSVDSYSTLPSGGSVQNSISGPNSSVIVRMFPVYEDETHISGLTLKMLPAAGINAVWFRNNECWHRSSDANIKIDGVSLATIGYSVDITTFGKGVDTAKITFSSVVEITPTTTVTMDCTTWGAEIDGTTYNNEYTLTTYTYDLSTIVVIANGSVYNVEDTGKNYAWNGSAWDDLGGTFITDNIIVGGSSALAGMTLTAALEYLLALHNS